MIGDKQCVSKALMTFEGGCPTEYKVRMLLKASSLRDDCLKTTLLRSPELLVSEIDWMAVAAEAGGRFKV